MKLREFIEQLKKIEDQDATLNILFEFCMSDEPPRLIEVKTPHKNYIVLDFDYRDEVSDDGWNIEHHVYGG